MAGLKQLSGADPGIKQRGGGGWRARERQSITGVWGRSPSGVQGQQGRIQELSKGADHRGWRAREREPTGVWGGAPSGVQGQSPWSGGQGRSPLKLKNFQFFNPKGEPKFSHFQGFLGNE